VGPGPAAAPPAYSPLALVQTESAGGGVQTSVSKVTPSTTAVYDPQASFANADGLVAAPNVDLAQEFVGQLLASCSFAANAAVLKADDRNNKALLDITV
jgi:flagellar basal-body rod protein FlgC